MAGLPSRKYMNIIPIEFVKQQTFAGENNKYPIQYVQLDPNGLCNAKCWYCPVAYEGNPKSIMQNMSIELMEDILKQLADGRGDFVKKNMKLIVPYNFNEVLLYPHFKEMLDLYRKYGFIMPISTNGVNLTKSKVDLIKEYQDVVKSILLNVPSAFPEEWSEQTGFNVKLFDRVLHNIRYAVDNLNKLIEDEKIKFIFNHFDENSVSDKEGWAKMMENSPKIDLDLVDGTAVRTRNKFKELFPEITLVESHEVLDRLGFFERLGIFTNSPYIKEHIKRDKEKVIGCYFDGDSQTENVLHINADGSVHLCCQDFNMESIFLNVKDMSLKEIWHSKQRREAIKEAYNTFCKDCQYAVWE